MPAENRIAAAVYTFRQNANLLERSFGDLDRREWLRRPAERSNPVLWIVGHMIWSRSRVLAMLGEEWTRPWLPLFARGATLADDAQYPAPEEMMAAWHDVTAHLTAALDAAPAEALAAPVGEKSPSYDGKVGGMVTFLAFHESYHVGQVAYLRCWLGHDGVVG
jgi:uncharacterized damage-inducible protein DinB